MFDQRDLSLKIVQAKGDYLWTVKDNQEGLREDIDVLFQPHRMSFLSGTLVFRIFVGFSASAPEIPPQSKRRIRAVVLAT